ncbi:MAG TPA: alpha-L-arabinofuranosidase C-terminal domain-containing protein [Bryobacteraceae bacterium]|nr:alpha-L-arabinofuranosidase C-terminal domain-containing protein [Bryobacteraceae bacterium]
MPGVLPQGLVKRAFALLCLLAIPGRPQTIFTRTAGAAVEIEINAAKTAGYTIPRTIWGTFLEPIGRSIYGGLWAQLLENPSFEAGLWSVAQIRRMVDQQPDLARASGLGLPLPWEPLYYDQEQRYEPRWGDAANSSRSLMVMALPGKQTGVRQEVYLPAHRIRKYRGSLYAKHLSGPAAIEVSVRKRNRQENVLARARLELSGSGWKRYDFALEVEPGALARLEPADFAVAVEDKARVLLDQVTLFPADAIDGLDPEMIALARELKTPLVRFGGNFTSGYHWRDGIGPQDKRVSMLNQAWGIPEYNSFGTDEFLRFCKLIGAEPQIAVNLGSGTPEEAAGWVKYVNERWNGRSGGLLWELGNELWGTFQIGYPTLERVADRTRTFSEAIRRIDPRARLIATGQDPDHFREWNAVQLANAPEAFEYLATHFVVGANVRRPNATAEFIARSSFALPVGLERLLREMKAQIDAHERARGRVRIAFTEWLFHGSDDRVPRFSNMGGAICAAGFLNTLMRVADFTPIANMTGLIEFGGIWKKRGQVFAVPAYWAFRMYSNADVTRPVETRVAADAYDIEQGNSRIPEIRDVPFLDVVAALNDSGTRLTLFCVNRDTQRDLPAAISFSGFKPARRARVQTLAAVSIYQPNDEIRPEAVRPVESALEVSAPRFEYLFPRASVTVIEFNAGT